MLHYRAGMTVAASGQTLLLHVPEDSHLLFDHMSEIARASAS
jgi:hypothetical protein